LLGVLALTTAKMKRKTEERGSFDGHVQPESKKRALSSEEAATRFRDGLFDTAEQQKYTSEYAKSSPYVFEPLQWLQADFL
jgi:hypothetical protein